MRAIKILILLWICDHVLLQGSTPRKNGNITHSSPSGISTLVTPTRTSLAVNTVSIPTATEEKSAALTMAAFGVIIFIAILVLIVIILVSVVSLRFKCRHCKDVDEKKKPQHPVVSYSYSDADADTNVDAAAGRKKSVSLVSMKNLNTNNNKVMTADSNGDSKELGIMKTVVIHEEQEGDIK